MQEFWLGGGDEISTATYIAVVCVFSLRAQFFLFSFKTLLGIWRTFLGVGVGGGGGTSPLMRGFTGVGFHRAGGRHEGWPLYEGFHRGDLYEGFHSITTGAEQECGNQGCIGGTAQLIFIYLLVSPTNNPPPSTKEDAVNGCILLYCK